MTGAPSRLALDTPLGRMTLTAHDRALVALDWGDNVEPPPVGPDGAVLQCAAQQLAEYFSARRREFELPLRPAGTPFQLRVLAAMAEIPFGEVASYGGLARALGSAPRAVGRACGANPLPILIPCHRVLARGGGIGGYSGGRGLETKRFLLRHEAAVLQPTQDPR